MKINEMIDSRVAAMSAERARLMAAWAPIINESAAYLKEKGRDLTELDKGNIARCCENALLNAGKGRTGKLFETMLQWSAN